MNWRTMFTTQSIYAMLLSLPGIIIAITFHEVAHGYAAESMGDDTAKLAGRLSLNPFKHLDPLGFLSMLIFHFGWAKPVPVNPNNFKNRKKGMILVALSGCLTNLVLAFFALAALLLTSSMNNAVLMQILNGLYVYNLMFAVFNLLPIPPLDGSDIVAEFLPFNARQKYESIARYGSLILLVLVFSGAFSYIISPIMNAIGSFYMWILSGLFGLFGLL